MHYTIQISGYNAAGGGITLTTGFYTQGDTVNVHYFDDDGNGSPEKILPIGWYKNLCGYFCWYSRLLLQGKLQSMPSILPQQ